MLKNAQISQIIEYNSQASIYGRSTLEVRPGYKGSNNVSRPHITLPVIIKLYKKNKTRQNIFA